MTPLEEDILKSCRLKNGLCNCKETACGVYCEMEMKTPITPLEEQIIQGIKAVQFDPRNDESPTHAIAKAVAKIARERIEKAFIAGAFSQVNSTTNEKTDIVQFENYKKEWMKDNL